MQHINRIKEKNHMIISNDAVKVFDKIQHPTSFHYKSFYETENRRKVPQYNKSYIWPTYNQYHTKWGKTEFIFSEVRIETRVSIVPTFIQYSTGIPSQRNKAREKIKWIQIGNEVKSSLFAHDESIPKRP
jgi:hypothetical protein